MSTLRERRLQEILETLAGYRGADGDRAVRLSDLQAMQTQLGGVRREARRIASEVVAGDLTAIQQAAADAVAKADEALAKISAEIAERIAMGEDLTESIQQEAAAVRDEFAAADVLVSQDVTTLAARVGETEVAITDESSIRQSADALLGGRLEKLEASVGAQNLIETPIFSAGDPAGAWSDPATNGYGAITTNGHFSGFSFADELHQTGQAVVHTAVAGAFGDATMRFSGLAYVPAGSAFPARVGFRAETSDGTITDHVAMVAAPGDAAARFAVDINLPAGVVSVKPMLLSGTAADAGAAGHEVFWQDLRSYDVTLVNAAVSSEATVRAAEDEALGERIDTVEAQVGANFATLTNEYLTAADTTSAIALSASNLKAEIENPAGDSIGATLAADYFTAAQVNAAIATARLDLEATFAGAAYAITDPLLGSAHWSRVPASQGTFTLVPNERHPSGKTWAFTVALGQEDGLATNSGTGQWVGPEDADAYVVEVEFTLTSGSLNGAGISLEWRTTAAQGYVARADLSSALVGSFALNAPMRAQVVLPRPPNFSGTVEAQFLRVFANHAAFGDGAKSIRFHMVTVRSATAEERGEGAVAAKLNATLDQDYLTAADTQSAISSATTNLRAAIEDPNGGSVGATVQQQAAAIAEIDGYLAATYSFAVRAGSGGARLDLVATNDPDGATSVARIEAEFIILQGSVTSPLIAADSIYARHVVIGDGGNLVPDNQMLDPGTWIEGSNGDWALTATPSWTGFRTKGTVLLPGPMNSGGKTLRGGMFPVRAGVEYLMRCQRHAGAAMSGNVVVQFFDYDGGQLPNSNDYVFNVDASASTTWANRDFEKSLVAPASAIEARMVGYVASSDGPVRFAGFEFRPKLGSVEIQDGAILGRHLEVDTALINKLLASDAFIERLEVGTTLTIAGQAVGYDELASGAAHLSFQEADGSSRFVNSFQEITLHDFVVQHDGFLMFNYRATLTSTDNPVVARLKIGGVTQKSWSYPLATGSFEEEGILLPVSAGAVVAFTVGDSAGAFNVTYSRIRAIVQQRT